MKNTPPSTAETKNPGFAESLPTKSQTPEEACLEKEVREELYHTCRSLKPPYDEIALDYYYHEMEAAEIAQKRNRNIKTVQTQIYRARGMLRKHYDKKEGKRA